MNNKKVLIIRLSALGDTIHTLPLAYAIKNAYPECEISWVVEKKAQYFVKNNPIVNKCFVIDKDKKNFFEVIKQLRSEKFDIAIDVQQLFKSGVVLGLCGAKRRMTLKGGRELSFLFANELIEPKTSLFDINYHVIKRNLEPAAYLGIKTEGNVNFCLPQTSSEAKAYVDELLKNIEKSKPILVLSPATTWENKHWKNQYWTDIINEFADKTNIIITGTNADLALTEDILSGAISASLLNLSGKTNLEQLQELLSRADVVVSPDSGSAHIAWACQKPKLLTLFFATSANRTGAFGDNYVSIQSSTKCSPCMKKRCKRRNIECINTPNSKEIINILNKLLFFVVTL